MKCPTKSTLKERYDFLLHSHGGDFDKMMTFCEYELKRYESSPKQDHTEIKNNIFKAKEFIEFAKTQNNERD
tara:strand:- start:158 stop:373 length:216 start_codon:yes stop_codon:yes gene_type:complete